MQHLFGIPILCLFLSACGVRVIEGRGPATSEDRKLSASFTKVEISAPVDVNIVVGGAPALSIKGYANLMPHVRSEVLNGVLRIYVEEPTDIETDKPLTATISLPSLAGLDLNGASHALVTGVVSATKFDLDVSGDGTVDIRELQVGSFNADMSGSTELSLGSGTIRDGTFEISGSGEIHAMGVQQQAVSLEISGSGEAEAYAIGKLDVEISGSGTVRYKGHPAVTQQISGSGSVVDGN